MLAQLSGVFGKCTGLVRRVRCGRRVLGMYADRARDLIVSAGFIGSLERREALVNLLGRNKLPTASRIRFAGDPYLWEGASEINLSAEEVAFLFCLGQRGEKRQHGDAEVRIVWV